MARKGYLLLYRKLFDHEISNNPLIVALWIRLLCDANYEDAEVCWNSKVFSIKRGQLITSIEKLAHWLTISRKTVKSHLIALERLHQIHIKTFNKYTIITIQNYDRYQVKSHQNDLDTSHEKNTEKEYKEYKEPLSKDKESYGNPQINQLIGWMKTRLMLSLLDGSIKENRRYAFHLINKFGFDESMSLVDAVAENEWWNGRVTSMKKLYYNAVAVMSSATGRVYGATKFYISPEDKARFGIN